MSNAKPGQMLILAIIFLAVTMILASSLFSRTAGFLQFGSNSIMREQAVNVAEAGVDRALWQINATTGCTPNPECLYTSETNTAVGTTGTFTTDITDKTSELKTIVSTGCIPNCINARAKRTIKTDVFISTTNIAFNYAIQTGSGGINSMSGGSIINGNVWAGCPNPCTTANIVGTGNSIINGDAYATGTISTVAQGLTVNPEPDSRHPNQDPATAPTMPPLIYQDWIDAAGTTSCDADGIISSSTTIGPCKQTGNLTISGSATTVTVREPIYVTGNFALSGGAKLKLDDSFGSNETAMIVNGTITISGNSQVLPTNASPKGYILLATRSTLATAMDLSGGTLTGIFYVLDGTAVLSGGVHLSGLVAKTVSMSGGSTLDYDTGLASSQLTSGPGGSWQIKRGTYRIQ